MIDLRTLLAVMLVADLLLAGMMWIGLGRRLREDFALWSFGLVAQALACGLFAVRGAPQGSALVLGSTLLALSFTLQIAAMLAADRRHLPAWVHTAVIAGIAPPFALIVGEPAMATLFGGVVFGTLLLVMAGVAAQLHEPRSVAARGLMVTSFALAGIAFYTRGVGAMVSAEPTRAFHAPSLFESGLYLAVYAAVLVGSFGFVLLHRERGDATTARLSPVDALTGAYTRGSFNEVAERELSRARRAGQPLSLLLLDLDNLREETDQHGAPLAEPILRRFVEIVRGALRKEDLVVRFSSAQFLVLLPEVPGPGAVVVAGRIRREVEEEVFEFEGRRVPITVSAGVAARLDEGPESVASRLARANDALSLAQRRGRNRVVALSLGRSLAA
jgi:diguanylate cyclase (GGDEF)-like protein